MGSRVFNFFKLAALMFFMTSTLAFAQSYRDFRGEILVINDWDETAQVTLVMERHDEVIRRNWEIFAGDRNYLAGTDGERRIRVRARDRIKIKADSRPVAIGDVGVVRDGVWHVRVRDVYRAQRGRDRNRDDYRDGYRR
jgi:hypothetical protein